MSLPRISCLMPTFNRFPANVNLPEESLMAFLLQDYPNKELIIWNDTPGQTVRADYPDVVVVNTSARFRTMGEKLNAIAGLATGDLLCRWDDDDISLPHRLSYTHGKLVETGANFWRSTDYLYQHVGEIVYQDRSNVPVSGKAIFTREIFDVVRGHKFENSGQDLTLERDIKAQDPSKFIKSPVGIEDVHFIYRWGVSQNHLSGVSQRFPDKMEGYRVIGKKPIKEGTYELKPRWVSNYVRIAERIKLGEARVKTISEPGINWDNVKTYTTNN